MVSSSGSLLAITTAKSARGQVQVGTVGYLQVENHWVTFMNAEIFGRCSTKRNNECRLIGQFCCPTREYTKYIVHQGAHF